MSSLSGFLKMIYPLSLYPLTSPLTPKPLRPGSLCSYSIRNCKIPKPSFIPSLT